MKRTNVLFILTDDQGYGDLSCMGSSFVKTPHIDRLAADGVRCTHWYSGSAVCSPARASLLTGRFPGNAGVRSILHGHRTASGMPAHVPTIAKLLGEQGYATFLSGKWHLGATRACWPDEHGFQRWFGFLAGCVDFFSHIFYWGMAGNQHDPMHDLWEDGREVWLEGRYLTELITERAIGYVRDAHASGRPFFGYVAYNAPHYPMHAPETYKRRFAHLPWDRQIMAAMLAAVDDGVGGILAELERLGIAEDTLIVFTSDNGPSRETRNWLDGTRDPYYGGTTGGLKGHKFSLFDGGIRVPGVVRWPRGLPPGVVCPEPVGSFDATPTALRACGVEAGGREFDGTDVIECLAGRQPAPKRDLLWELGRQVAIRRGRWKLVLDGVLNEREGVADPVFLADMDVDGSETTNLAASHADLVADLSAKARSWASGIERRWTGEFAEGRSQGVTARS
jgi:arylsulfatase A-like enzyme